MSALLQFHAKDGDIKECCFPEPPIKGLPAAGDYEVTGTVRKCATKGDTETVELEVEVNEATCEWCFVLDTTGLDGAGIYDLEFEITWDDDGDPRICHYPGDGYGRIELEESLAD